MVVEILLLVSTGVPSCVMRTWESRELENMVMCVRTWHSADMLWTLIYPSMAILTSISEDHFEEQTGTQENSWRKVGME